MKTFEHSYKNTERRFHNFALTIFASPLNKFAAPMSGCLYILHFVFVINDEYFDAIVSFFLKGSLKRLFLLYSNGHRVMKVHVYSSSVHGRLSNVAMATLSPIMGSVRLQ